MKSEPQTYTENRRYRPPILGLEGLPYAGKTTLSRSLVSSGFSRLGELAEFFRNGDQFPKFSENTADARESFDWFVTAEVNRFSRLKEIVSSSPIVADRTLISSLAYSYARRKVFQIGDARDEHHMIRQAIYKHGYHIPPCIYLRLPINRYLTRRERTYDVRCEALGRSAVENVSIFDRERAFFSAQIEYYDTIAKRMGNVVCVLDGNAPVKENLFKALRWYRKIKTDFKSPNIEEMLL